MNDRVREILIAAAQAVSFSPDPAVMKQLRDGSPQLTLAQFNFDSFAWMEFCISLELQCGQELTPADIEGMRFVFQIEEWLRARL
jgi:hypothetical protein